MTVFSKEIRCFGRICLFAAVGALHAPTLAVQATQGQSASSPAPTPAPAAAPAPAAPLPELENFDVPPDIDPEAPLPPMPGLEVEWPDLDALAPKPPELEPEPLPDNAVAVTTDAGTDEQPQVASVPVELTLPPSLLSEEAGLDTATASVLDQRNLLDMDGLWRYRVTLGAAEVADRAAFEDRFFRLSALRLGQRSEANSAQISRRLAEDVVLLEQMLRGAGHYDGVVTSNIDRTERLISVVLSAEPGPLYHFGEVRLNGLEAVEPQEAVRLRASFPVQSGDAVVTDTLIAAQLELQEELLETGYPFGQVGQELVTINHETRLGDLDQPVAPGARLRFGQIVAADNGMFGARHMQRIARFDPGEWYRQSDVEDLRRALLATGLVASASVEPVTGAQAGTVDLNIAVEPAPLRTISGGLGYGTGEGFRAEVGWEHRNLFPPEGALILRGVVGTQEQLGSITFRRNNFQRRDRTLTFQALVSHVERVAYEANTALFAARLERQSTLLFQKRWIWSAGAELVATDERDERTIAGAGRQTYFVGALPLFLGHDRSDDLLNPTRGYRASIRFSPEASLRGDAFFYVRAQLDGSAYLPVRDGVVLAGRLRLGTIAGAQTDGIAPSRRYYAGGGSSVRGYGYQVIGPVDAAGNPFGGRSLFEAAAEARIRLPLFDGAFSVVPFLDAGNVYQSEYPDFGGLRFGAGIGVRYLTNFGPIRVDLGTPLNPRPGDSRIAVYVSLGQAF